MTTSPSYPASERLLREELLAIVHLFHAYGWSPATSTNYSFRNTPTDGDYTFTISRSGVDKAEFMLDDFMVVDALGIPTPPYAGVRPSAETQIHTFLYARDAGIGAILHTHTVANTVLSRRCERANKKALSLTGYELLKGLSGITTHDTTETVPVIPNAQNMDTITEQLSAYFPTENTLNRPIHGFLLASHGLYTWGRNLAEAKRHVETFEFLFECENAMNGA